MALESLLCVTDRHRRVWHQDYTGDIALSSLGEFDHALDKKSTISNGNSSCLQLVLIAKYIEASYEHVALRSRRPR